MRLRALFAALPLAALAVAVPGSASANAGTLKPALHGLTTQGSAPIAGYPVANVVVRVSWAELEPARDQYDFSSIDAGLAKAATGGWGAKLRVMAGTAAPDWAKTLDGPAWPYLNSAGKTVGTVGRWWTPSYGDAYGAMMTALAARYDTNPTLREVALTRCMTQFAEPLWREFMSQPANVRNALAAGYTEAADRDCAVAQTVTDGAPWRHTHVDLALTGAPYIADDGTAYVDNKAPVNNLSLLEKTWGAKGLPENNQLAGGRESSRLYQAIDATGEPDTYQVETYTKLAPAGVPGLLAALNTGCNVEQAASVELPTGYQNATPAQLQPYADSCSANPS